MTGKTGDLSVDISEAFLYGLLAGQQKILKEIIDTIKESDDIEFVKAYVLARMNAVQTSKELADYLKGGGVNQ